MVRHDIGKFEVNEKNMTRYLNLVERVMSKFESYIIAKVKRKEKARLML